MWFKNKTKIFPLYNVDGVYFIFISFTNLFNKEFSLKTFVIFSLIIIYLISTFLFIGFSDNIRYSELFPNSTLIFVLQKYSKIKLK